MIVTSVDELSLVFAFVIKCYYSKCVVRALNVVVLFFSMLQISTGKKAISWKAGTFWLKVQESIRAGLGWW